SPHFCSPLPAPSFLNKRLAAPKPQPLRRSGRRNACALVLTAPQGTDKGRSAPRSGFALTYGGLGTVRTVISRASGGASRGSACLWRPASLGSRPCRDPGVILGQGMACARSSAG